MNLLRVSLAVTGIAVVLGTGPQAAQRDARERHVYVGVTTSNGAPVPNLTTKDFVVREDDRVREILRVEPAPPPSHVAILVDNSEAAQQLIPDIRDGLARFVQTFSALDTPPAMSVVTFGERPTTESPFTTSLPMTARAVVGLIARPQSGAYLLDAIVETSQAIGKQQPRPLQPAIVAFSIDESTEFSEVRAERVADALKEAGASLWIVTLGSGADNRERERVVGDVSRNSGGMNRPTLSQSGIDAALRAVAAAILTRYDVVYGRPEGLLPPSRLSVEGRDKGWRVMAPRWTSQ